MSLTDDEILEHYATFESEAEAGEFAGYRTILKTVVKKFGTRFGFSPTEEELEDFPDSMRNWVPFEDTVNALESLASHYKLAVISNVDRDLFSYSAQHLKVPFDWVITADQVGSYKPSLRNFEFAFDKLGARPTRILHVAQSLYHDHVPAKQLGLATVWVNRRRGLAGGGATPSATASPDLEVPDLRSLVALMEVSQYGEISNEK